MAVFYPLLVGYTLAKAGGKTNEAAMAYSAVGVWTTRKLQAGAIGSLWLAARAVGGLSVQGLLAGYIGGAVVGTAISGLMFGKEGAKKAIDFYAPGGADMGDLYSEMVKAPGRVANIVEGNRAVVGNAAGMIPGQSILTPTGQFSMTSQYNPAEGEYKKTFQDHDPIYGTRYNPFTGELNPGN